MEAGVYFHLSAAEKNDKSDAIKSSILTCVGKKGREVYNTFTFATDQDKMKFTKIIEKMDEFCTPRKNITFSRYKFFTCRQKEGESFDDFVTNLKKLSQHCEFGTLCNSLILDVIIIGILDNRLRERLLREHDRTLENTIKHCKAAEETKQHTEISHQLHSVKKKSLQKDTQAKANDYFKNCKLCAGSHKCGNYPVFSKKCKSCKKTGHFAKCCPKQKSVNQVQKVIPHLNHLTLMIRMMSIFIGFISAEVEVDDTSMINHDSNCYSPDNDDDVTAIVMSIDGDDHSVNFSEWSVVLNTNVIKLTLVRKLIFFQKRNFMLYKTDLV